MSANILKNDRIVSLEKCWHGLEEIVEQIEFANSGLDWQVEKRPLFIDCGNDKCRVDGWEAVVRKDKDLVLQIPKQSYAIIQNSRVWETLENALTGIGHKVQVTGSLGDCRKVFISISLDENQDYLVNKDKFRNFLTFVTSHDGTMAFEAYDTAIRVVCSNTLNASRSAKGNLNLKVYHTQNNELKIKDMEKTIDELLVKRQEFYTSLEYLMSKPVSLKQANEILTGFIANGEEVSTRAANQVETMLGLFQKGQGNSGVTAYDLLNGVTEYYTHQYTDNAVKRLVSNEFGAAGDKKIEFYDSLLSDVELDKLAKRGEKLLAAASAATVTV